MVPRPRRPPPSRIRRDRRLSPSPCRRQHLTNQAEGGGMIDSFAPLVTALTHTGFKGGRPVTRKQWSPILLQSLGSPTDLAALMAGSSDPEVRSSLIGLDEVMDDLARLEDQGVWALTCLDDRYPDLWHEKLTGRMPAVIFGLGDPQLLNLKCLAVLGSRDAPEASLSFAQ